MKLLRLSVVLSCLALTVHSSLSAAQEMPRYHATFGWNRSQHRGSPGPEQVILEGMAGRRFLRGHQVGVVVSAVGGTDVIINPNKMFGDDLTCPFDPATQSCRADMPAFSYAGLQVGGEWRHKAMALSLVSGPTAFRYASAERTVRVVSIAPIRETLPGATVGSIHTRAEGAIYIKRKFGIVLSSTWRHVLSFRGGTYDINGIGIGIRYQK